MSEVRKARLVVAGGERSVWFWCAGCETHHRIVDGRWTWNQSETAPTFHPSVKVTYNGPDAGADRGDGQKAPAWCCHSFVRDGRIQDLPDSTHALAGQTVELEPISNSFGQ